MIVNMVQPLTRPILSSLTDAITAALGGFNPSSLFADGSVGVLYDNNDLSTFFSDSAGTTAAVVNGPVGLQLDKSANLALGAETLNGTGLASGTWAYSGDVITRNSSSTGLAQSSVSVVAGKTYLITFTVSGISGDTFFFRCGGAASGNITANGSYTYRITATSASSAFQANPWVGSAGEVTISGISVKELAGNHRYQTTATSRPTLRGTPNGLDGDGTDDSMLVASSGGGTTGFLFQSAIKLDAINKRQTLWSDAGTNTGYKVEINASNQLVFSAGNGTAYTSVTTANTVAAGTTYSVECYDDGTNLVAILNQGTPATAARPTGSAGTASFTMQKDNGAASGFMDGVLYSAIYLRNTAKDSATRAASMRWVRQKAGL